MMGLAHGSDVTVLQDRAFSMTSFLDDGFDHGPGQVVGSNHLVGEQHTKRWVDPAQQPVAEIRFLSRLHGVDVGRPEDINTREIRWREAPSRPLPCSAQTLCGFVPSGPRRSRSRMRTPRRGCWRGELARTRLYSPRLSCGVPRPSQPPYTRPGKRPQRPDPRAPRRARSSPRSRDAEPLSSLGCEMPRLLRPIDVTRPTAGFSSA